MDKMKKSRVPFQREEFKEAVVGKEGITNLNVINIRGMHVQENLHGMVTV